MENEWRPPPTISCKNLLPVPIPCTMDNVPIPTVSTRPIVEPYRNVDHSWFNKRWSKSFRGWHSLWDWYCWVLPIMPNIVDGGANGLWKICGRRPNENENDEKVGVRGTTRRRMVPCPHPCPVLNCPKRQVHVVQVEANKMTLCHWKRRDPRVGDKRELLIWTSRTRVKLATSWEREVGTDRLSRKKIPLSNGKEEDECGLDGGNGWCYAGFEQRWIVSVRVCNGILMSVKREW